MLAVFAVVLAATALSIHAVGHLARRAEDLAGASQRITPSALFPVLDATDAILAMVIVAGGAALLWVERSGRTASRFLATATQAQVLVLLTILLAWLGQTYLFPGLLLGGDSGGHVARFLEFRHAFASGAFPAWTNYQYLGSPLFGFTGPLIYLTGGALDLLIRDPVVTAKALLFTLHVAGGLAFYWLLLRIGLSRVAALIASLGFAGCFAHLRLFLYAGVFPQAFTILFLALVFAAAEGLMRSAYCRALDWVLFALATGGLIVNHQPHALFVGLYLAVFGVGRVISGQWRLRALPRLVTAGLVGVGISLCAVIPVIAEADWVMIVPESALFHLHAPTLIRLLHLIEWRNDRTTGGTDYWAYLGITIVLLAVLGAWAALTDRLGEARRRLVLSVLPCLILSLFLSNPVVRDVMFIFFFIGILAACGVEQVARIDRSRGRLVLLASVAVLLDLSSTAVQPVFRTDKQFFLDAGRYLQQNAPDERVVQMAISDNDVEADIGPDASPLSAYTMVQRIAGTHNMAATRVHNYAEIGVELAARDLRRSGWLSPRSVELLSLLNATRIICFTSEASGCPDRFADAAPEGPLGRVIHLPNASPVLFSQSLSLLAPGQGLDKPMIWREDWAAHKEQITEIAAFLSRYLQTARIDLPSHQAQTLPVRSLPASDDGVSGGSAPWHPQLLNYDVSLQTVKLAIESDRPGFLQLSYPWFPGLRVTMNGQEVRPLQGALNLMVLKLPAGRSDIEIRPFTTPIRFVSNMLSAFFFALCLVVGAILTFRRRAGRAAR